MLVLVHRLAVDNRFLVCDFSSVDMPMPFELFSYYVDIQLIQGCTSRVSFRVGVFISVLRVVWADCRVKKRLGDTTEKKQERNSANKPCSCLRSF